MCVSVVGDVLVLFLSGGFRMSHRSGCGDITSSASTAGAYNRAKHMQPFYFSLLLSCTRCV